MNNVIAITGGNSGIGRAVIEKYLKNGHRVASFNRTIGEMEPLISEYKNNFIEFKGDVKSPEDMEKFYSYCHKRWKKIDIVLANAGIAKAHAIEAITLEDFENTLSVNVIGVFLTVQKSLPYLSNTAYISLISSIQANKGNQIWYIKSRSSLYDTLFYARSCS